MSKRRPAPNDAPSRLVVPGYGKDKRQVESAEQERWESLAGPVEVRRVPPTKAKQ